jgi:hypothetical protein
MPSGMMLMGATQMTILTGWDHSHLSPAEGLFFCKRYDRALAQ